MAGPHAATVRDEATGRLVAVPLLPGGGGGGGGGTVGPGNTIYVALPSAGGSDTSGVRGDKSKPVATYAKALSLAQDGDHIEFGPGFFNEVDSPVWPVGLAYLSISAVDGDVNGGGTVVQWNGVGDGITPPGFVRRLSIRNIMLYGGASPPLSCQSATDKDYLSAGLWISNVRLSSFARAMVLRKVGKVNVLGLVIESANASIIDTCNSDFYIGVVDKTGGGSQPSLVFGWDDDHANSPNPGRLSFVLSTTTLTHGLFFFGQPSIVTERGCVVGALTTDVSQTPVGMTEALSGMVPDIHCHHRMTGNINFKGSIPDLATPAVYDFDGLHIENGSVLFKQSTELNGRSNISMRGLICPEFTNISADIGIDLTVKTECTPNYVTAGSGTIKPGEVVLTSGVVPGANVVPFGFTAPYAPGYFLATTNQAAANAGVGVTGATATGVTVDVAAGAVAASVTVSVKWPV